MSKTAAILSLHFSPAHASHMIALGKLLRDLDFTVTFLLRDEYLLLADFSGIGLAISMDKHPEAEKDGSFDVAVFSNAAVNNCASAGKMSARGAAVFYIFHEPDSVLNHLAEGWKDILKLVIARYSSIAMIRQCTGVIVPSGYARLLYEQYFYKYNNNVHEMALLFSDEVEAVRIHQPAESRRYFSFIGNAVKAHDFDAFLEMAKHAIRAGSTIDFSIATKSDLRELLSRDRELSQYVKEGRIKVQHGKVLSNDQINQCHLESFCVWNVYKCSTQSGVLPRAFMAGTPVVAKRMGSFPEYIQVGVNGEFVASADDWDAVLRVAETMKRDVVKYVAGCRKTFVDTFFYEANRETLATILASGCQGICK